MILDSVLKASIAIAESSGAQKAFCCIHSMTQTQQYADLSRTHTVTLLTIAGCKYLIDVGFGANGPTTVLPLSIGCEQAQIVPSTMRLTYEPIAQNLDQSQSVWLYQYRIDGKSEWETGYSFVEIEFTPQDLEAMNLYPWTSRHSFFTHKVVAVRFTTAGETLENPIANEQDMDKVCSLVLYCFVSFSCLYTVRHLVMFTHCSLYEVHSSRCLGAEGASGDCTILKVDAFENRSCNAKGALWITWCL